jgi:rhamnogalacturonyl hydrolase YesR
MERYFDEDRAAALYTGGKIETSLELVACRYIAANPRLDYTARPFLSGEIIRNKDYRYDADFAKIFPGAAAGTYVYAWGKYRAPEAGALKFTLIPRGPVKIWMNGEMVYGTTAETERYDKSPVSLSLPVRQGVNHLALRCTCTPAGFGAEFGTWLGKLDYYFFRGMERPCLPAGSSGYIEGFDYTAPLAEALADPSPENLAPLCLPLPAWTGDEQKQGVFGRIFAGAPPGSRALARTEVYAPAAAACVFSGVQSGNCALYAGKTCMQSFTAPGPYQFEYPLQAGPTIISVVSARPQGGETPWDFSLELQAQAAVPLCHTNPFFPGAGALAWVYAGPFRETPNEALLEFDRERLIGGGGEQTWWRLDLPGGWVRLYNENPLYGHWNYPLGVTLYGLIETARYFETTRSAAGPYIASYARSHGAKSLHTLEYALFDKERFGGATSVHHLLTSIDSLDDCGSFGSLILELAKDRDIGDYAAAVNYTGEHILHRQDRREEGCFWRRRLMHRFHNDTLWADDLYMSVPFLCRYAAYTQDPAILDLAAAQFEGFKKYLYMADKRLMAHVYDCNRNMNTGIPWGRGNGWTIFSLSEVLTALPPDHPRRPFLLDFFRSLAAGCLACQDASGMWRQVLDMPSSYIESSCTAMFICAFSRGIRKGWFDGEALPYRLAAEKGWQALERYAIDKNGNVYGVCRGSEFSFNPRYYAEHLLPRLNDTHGIGIVLLAGVELLKLAREENK